MAAGPTGPTSPPGSTIALALTAGVARQVRREWIASPVHRAMLGGRNVQALAVRPKDMRPADAEAGRRIMTGVFVLSGATMQAGPKGDPFDRPSPHRRFAVALHRMGWLKDLLAADAGAAAEGLRLYLDWRRLFGGWNAFSWHPEVLERRVFNLACAAKAICDKASDAETALVARDLYRQARHLLSTIEGPERAAERAAVAAVAGAAIAGEAGQQLKAQALDRLVKALPRTVQADGGHASRSPQAALELLFDLQTLDEALVQRGQAAPDEVTRTIDRLTGAVRFFTLADGALPAFQGGEELSRAYLSAARASEEEPVEDGEPPRPTPVTRNGFHRLDGASLQVVADGAAPASGPFSVTACAQPLAVEILAGGKRLITNCGWSPDASGPPALRLIDAGSTATLGDQACGEPLGGLLAALLGPRLTGADAPVLAERRESEEALWLELQHDGWLQRFRLQHRRRIYLDLAGDELRGEDRFTPVGKAPRDSDKTRRFLPITVCFHIHPDVRASLAMDKKSVLLRADGKEAGWWLRNDAAEVSIETSVHFHEGQPRRAQRVVLHGQARMDVGARLRWKLAKAEIRPRQG
ncbi:MAG: heparinase II/III family protein [Phenylobacterium sp.]|uniref:heparinase II/III family protein n=1 Tax=Phenylobacterium sp. TaxID=1871053 RepID=UPI00391A8967